MPSATVFSRPRARTPHAAPPPRPLGGATSAASPAPSTRGDIAEIRTRVQDAARRLTRDSWRGGGGGGTPLPPPSPPVRGKDPAQPPPPPPKTPPGGTPPPPRP